MTRNPLSICRLRKSVPRDKPDRRKYHETYRFLRDFYNTTCLVTNDVMHDECSKPVSSITTRVLIPKTGVLTLSKMRE